MKRAARRLLSLLVALACLAYFARQIWKSWPEITAISWQAPLLVALLGSILLQAACSLLDAWSWGFLLRALKVRAATREAMGVFLVSQFAKYLPGNVGQHVGRIALTSQLGWQPGRVIVSILVENGFAVGAGGLVAGAGISFAGAGALGASRLIVAAAVLVLGWVSGVVVLKALLARPPARVARWLSLVEPVEISAATLTPYLGVHLLSYAGGFISFTAIVSGLFGHFPAESWKIPAAVSASWLAGYLVPGAPAGLGVREATLTALLGSSLGMGVVVSAALVWRFSALLGDALVLLVGLGLRRGGAARARSATA
ncbi:MAG TPA: lysylphosphatidylglycerol synthase domain-containing protein [Polyangiaceae bacterium]|jgi:hypothetical protein|nr:lysylphosphatidylglycerol synthase domain-containing protein [Polyangiaceae bacterium]